MLCVYRHLKNDVDDDKAGAMHNIHYIAYVISVNRCIGIIKNDVDDDKAGYA
jgi:hypothetical protein